MASIQAKIINQLLFVFGLKTFFADPDKVPAKIAKKRQQGPALPSKSLRRNFRVTELETNGYRCFRVEPLNADTRPEKHVLYFHGGAYVLDIVPEHWKFIARLVQATGRSVTVPIYPLAPETTCADLIPAMRALFLTVAKQYGPENITLMGDSAGGGLSLALAHMLRDTDGITPESLVLLSPWLDVMATDPAQADFAARDKMLSLESIRGFAKIYAGDLSTENPKVSPLYGEHHDLPRIQMFAGTADTLCPDSRRFNEIAAKAGLSVDYREYADMFHVWMLLPIPEGKQAMSEIAAFLG